MKLITPEELSKTNDTCRQTYLNIIITNKIIKSEDFDAISVEGSVTTIKPIAILPFGSMRVQGVTRIPGHTKHIQVTTEPPEVYFWIVLSHHQYVY